MNSPFPLARAVFATVAMLLRILFVLPWWVIMMLALVLVFTIALSL